MADQDVVRVLRLYEFTGLRSDVERQIVQSIHGTKRPGKVFITGASLREFPEIVDGQLAEAVQTIAVLESLLEDARAERDGLRDDLRESEEEIKRLRGRNEKLLDELNQAYRHFGPEATS